MLKRAVYENFQSIAQLCENSIIGIKILCQINSYGFDKDFLEVWIMSEKNVITSVFTKFYDDISLVASENADFEQLKAFLEMLYYNTIMCPYSLCEKINAANYIVKNAYSYVKCSEKHSAETLTEDNYREAYSLISREIPGSFKEGREAYLSFISDYTYRERRGFARGVCTHIEGKLSSVAITSAETDKKAIISGVACDSSFRKKGLGKTTVLSIVSILRKDNKKPYVIALNENAEGFYEHIGFKFEEKIAFVERINNV